MDGIVVVGMMPIFAKRGRIRRIIPVNGKFSGGLDQWATQTMVILCCVLFNIDERLMAAERRCRLRDLMSPLSNVTDCKRSIRDAPSRLPELCTMYFTLREAAAE